MIFFSQTHLYRYQEATNNQLRLGRDERRPLRRLLAGLKNPRYSIGFGEQRSVHHSEAKTRTETEEKKQKKVELKKVFALCGMMKIEKKFFFERLARACDGRHQISFFPHDLIPFV